MTETNFQNLKVRNKSSEMVEYIYKITLKFPNSESYWLISQMRRVSISIASNIAEGDQRISIKENIRFLYMAKWSAAEMQSHTIISYRLWFIDKNIFDELHSQIYDILRMLSVLICYKTKKISKNNE